MVNLKDIIKGEDGLVNEIKQITESGHNIPEAQRQGIDINSVKALINGISTGVSAPMTEYEHMTEAVVVAHMRPVLFVKSGRIEIPDSDELKERIIRYKSVIEQPLNSVGRIELKNHQLRNIGTGWLITDNIIVTNRHVAEIFAAKNTSPGKGGVFRKNFIGQNIEVSIDFKEEYVPNTDSDNQYELEIDKIIYLPDADKNLPDIAFLKIKNTPINLNPIPFIKDKLSIDQLIGVVGYPLQDPRGVVDSQMENKIFGNIFGVKRYSPGQILNVPTDKWYFLHDATTLGGNSGSLVQDMESGCAVGLHFAGVLLEANYAVKGIELLNLTAKLNLKNVYSFNTTQSDQILVEPDFVLEKPFDLTAYETRKGFANKFLEDESDFIRVNLPTIKNKADILILTNSNQSILKYTHFSVQMSMNRRMCIYSAVNIDGQKYKRIKRTGWRYDPRIPEEYQIMKECYGNAPKFSRGHMTRREDPNWGDNAIQGNDDSMHVTNAVPQMQNFNGGVWLTLENYALENAKRDKQKICVFTGPYLSDNDPIKHGVKIPVEFWKVIVSIHDETKKLCATGYTMSQENFLRSDEFVYGEFLTYQTPIRVIEKKAGLKFSKLAEVDPLKDEIFESINSPIQSVRQIRYY
jgi:endonuclease G